MADLLDKNNAHLFLEKPNNSGNSFIANVNKLANELVTLQELRGVFTKEDVHKLAQIADVDFSIITEDLAKGSLNGYRKLDISLIENFANYSSDLSDEDKSILWSTPSNQVYYEGITVYFVDKTSIYKDFTELGINTPIYNHNQLYSQLDNWAEFKAKADYTMFNIVTETTIPNYEFIRIWDGEGDGSSIDKIVLHVAPQGQNLNYDAVFAGAKEHDPEYDWVSTTSMFQVISNKINELVKVANSSNELVLVANHINEITQIYAALDELVGTEDNPVAVYQLLDKLILIAENIDTIQDLVDKANQIKTTDFETYGVTYTLHDTNTVKNILIGTKFYNSEYTFEVTGLDPLTNKVAEGIITPSTVTTDNSGLYTFQTQEENPKQLLINVVCRPEGTTVDVTKDLPEVYIELQTKLVNAQQTVSYLANLLNHAMNELATIEADVARLDLDKEAILAEAVLKKSTSPQTIESDIIIGATKSLVGVKSDGSNATMLKTLKIVNDGVVRDTVVLGNINEHLQLHTSKDSVYGNKVSVVTPEGVKRLAFTDDIPEVKLPEIKPTFTIGECFLWSGTSDTIPSQCVSADGLTYNIEEYPDAYAVLGTTYGGDGVTTFGVPDLSENTVNGMFWIITLGNKKDSTGGDTGEDEETTTVTVYAGLDGVYCGMEELYAGKTLEVSP